MIVLSSRLPGDSEACRLIQAPRNIHIHGAADAVAEVIGVFGFEQEYHALKVETGSDGKPRFTHQPFLEVEAALKLSAASTMLALLRSHAPTAFLTSLHLVAPLSSALSVSVRARGQPICLNGGGYDMNVVLAWE